MYGKLMSISDELMWRYYELCTSTSMDAIGQLKQLVASGKLHPKKAKEGLAMQIIREFHDENAAREAHEEFARIFAQNQEPDDVPEHRFPVGEGSVSLPVLLTGIGLAATRSEVMRLLKQGAVRVDDVRHPAEQRELAVQAGDVRLFRVGRRKFARVTFEG